MFYLLDSVQCKKPLHRLGLDQLDDGRQELMRVADGNIACQTFKTGVVFHALAAYQRRRRQPP
jgi:hypothetical protein